MSRLQANASYAYAQLIRCGQDGLRTTPLLVFRDGESRRVTNNPTILKVAGENDETLGKLIKASIAPNEVKPKSDDQVTM